MRFIHRSGTAPAGNSLRISLLGLLLFLYGTIVVEGSSSPAPTTTASSSQQNNQQLLVNVTGILANVLCWRSRWALDGADMWYAPWNHTVRCTLLPICLPEGFAILQDSLFQQQGGSNSAANSYTTPKTSPLLDLSVEQVKAFSPDAGHKFNDTWYLSAEGNTKAEAFLRTLPTVRNNVLVEVKGYVSHLGATSGLLDAIQFRDLSPKTNGAATTSSSSTTSTTTAADSVASAVSISGGAGSEFIGSSTNSGSAGFQFIIPIVILLTSALCASVTLA